jgi:protein-tyrosine phosphatase
MKAELHSHILPGLDDGPDSIKESLRMCKAYEENGVKRVVATPHFCVPKFKVNVSVVKNRLQRLRDGCEEAGIDIELRAGAEVRLTPELLTLFQEGELLTLAGQGRHLLVEFPPDVAPPIKDLVFQLGVRGVTVVIAHPERNREFSADPDLLEELINGGCLVQICIGSLLGDFGGKAKKAAGKYLKNGFVHLVAGDAHGYEDGYWPDLNKGMKVLSSLVGEEEAKIIAEDNPLSIFRGEEITAG